jgi:hypothetical protein
MVFLFYFLKLIIYGILKINLVIGFFDMSISII